MSVAEYYLSIIIDVKFARIDLRFLKFILFSQKVISPNIYDIS